MSAQPVLDVRNVSHGFNDQSGHRLSVLESLDLRINPGDSVAIIGPSGAGKSTLLSLLAGLDIPESGEILFQGEAFSGLSEDQRAAVRRGRIGFVFQSFQLLQGLTAVENVMLPLELTGMSVAQAKQRAMKWLERVGLGARTHHRPRMLSGGEQQRVALARAFVNEPALLFADEPTGNLDRRTGESVSELLFELNQETGTTLILVTHDERLASRCQRILSLEDGTLNEVAA
ncbi:MAG TPA: ABC transporter [Gammaproteobacteria bacterium]|jgi:putative ABC transport system ATP-binding protein|nr:ABC transporter ATP-binding protein [Pseudomonadota bacterium]MDA7749507.1 ABC transporter ATP-binding protein [Litorivicinus sp.]MDA8631092.1 ABC transporter ATP-binding protein [Litorivicinaceae bacterium]NBR74441.1 ABC transporter ATP-binding protein [Gammaproteobacteria bacterium]MDA8665685.1 ABC transporter ATP-binding protein [Litorivicinaceae bacterium]